MSVDISFLTPRCSAGRIKTVGYCQHELLINFKIILRRAFKELLKDSKREREGGENKFSSKLIHKES